MGSSVDKLIELFTRFPGIGPRQARRFVYFLLSRNEAYIRELTSTIGNLRGAVGQCTKCYRFHTDAGEACSICQDPNVDQGHLMIIEKDVDLDSVRRTDSYEGNYFILGGLLPILEKEPERKIRIKELESRITELVDLKEVTVALSASPVGDNTIEYLKERLSPALKERGIKLSLLGRGISTGSELEYSDPETLKAALRNRG